MLIQAVKQVVKAGGRVLGLLVFLQIRKVIHLQRLLIAPLDELVRPDEEHAGEETGIVLKAGLEAHCFVELKLRFALSLFLHSLEGGGRS